jgi:hypothetical protein
VLHRQQRTAHDLGQEHLTHLAGDHFEQHLLVLAWRRSDQQNYLRLSDDGLGSSDIRRKRPFRLPFTSSRRWLSVRCSRGHTSRVRQPTSDASQRR